MNKILLRDSEYSKSYNFKKRSVLPNFFVSLQTNTVYIHSSVCRQESAERYGFLKLDLKLHAVSPAQKNMRGTTLRGKSPKIW